MGKSSGSGGSTSTSQADQAYNARMAAIAEAQQAQASELFDIYKGDPLALESAQQKAALGLVPLQTQVDQGNLTNELALQAPTQELSLANLSAQLGLLPSTTAAAKAKAESYTALAPQATQSAQDFMSQSKVGVDSRDWAARAGTDASLALSGQQDQLKRNASRMGLNPTSGSYVRASQDAATTGALGVAAATTAGRRAAEDENWKRLSSGASLGASLLK